MRAQSREQPGRGRWSQVNGAMVINGGVRVGRGTQESRIADSGVYGATSAAVQWRVEIFLFRFFF